MKFVLRGDRFAHHIAISKGTTYFFMFPPTLRSLSSVSILENHFSRTHDIYGSKFNHVTYMARKHARPICEPICNIKYYLCKGNWYNIILESLDEATYRHYGQRTTSYLPILELSTAMNLNLQ